MWPIVWVHIWSVLVLEDPFILVQEFLEWDAVFFHILIEVIVYVRGKEPLTIHFSYVIRFPWYMLGRFRTVSLARLGSELFLRWSLPWCFRHVNLIGLFVKLRLAVAVTFRWSLIVLSLACNLGIPHPVAMAVFLLLGHLFRSHRWCCSYRPLLSAISKN